jgi:hypothetical protein
LVAAVRVAVVIGVNQPDQPGVGRLRYADDDATAMHRLLQEAGVESVLLTRLDPDTARLWPGLVPDGPATWEVVRATFARLRGADELYLFYSGHGDVADGEGYVALEEGRLTRSRLRELLAASGAARKHVMIDACRSYYLAFAKGGQGRRSKLEHRLVTGPVAAAEGVGFALSTSSDRESHEWERYQGGVFSYELRSALRGAADADGDGVITYAELGAFLRVANQGIANARLRPDYAVRPPASLGLNEPLLRWPAASAALVVDRQVGHLYVEDSLGIRVVDAHPGADQRLVLHLPGESPLYLREVGGAYEIVLAAGSGRLSRWPKQPLKVAAKGALQVAFESLFSVAYGMGAVDRYARAWRAEVALVAADPAAPPVSGPSRLRAVAGWSFVTAASAGLALHLVAFERWATGRDEPQDERHRRNRMIGRLTSLALIADGVALVSATSWLGLGAWLDEDTAGVRLSGRF